MTSTFPATRWSIIAAAGAGGDRTTARTALSELCRLYWFPLYGFARRKGLSPEDAEDATQAFFVSILETNLFAAADQSLGRLRSFLLTAFSHRLADAHRAAGRQKRGGGAEIVSLDLIEAEGRYHAEPSGTEPIRQFEVDWAAAVLDGAVCGVEKEYHSSGRGAIFAALRPFLATGAAEVPDQAQLAASLGMSHGTLRQALFRLRDRFRLTLRAQIADTLRDATEAAIDEEIRTLRAVLAGGA